MAAHIAILGLWLQDADTFGVPDIKLLMIFIGLLALSMLVLAIVSIVIAIGAAKAQKRIVTLADEVHTKVMPTIDSVQTLLRDTSPKLKILTDNLTETSHIVRAKAQEFDVTISDANHRASQQIARVDGMVNSVLDATQNITNSVHQTIRTPVREIAGVMNGLKAGLDVLIGRARGFNNSNSKSSSSKSSTAHSPMDGGTDLVG